MRFVLLLATAALIACGGTEPVAPGIVLPPGSPPAELPPEQTMAPPVFTYINGVVNIMQANSINRLTIDWTTFRSSVFESGRGAQTIAQLSSAIRTALTLLGDGHSFYISAQGQLTFVPTRSCVTTFTPTPPPDVPSNIGYVRVGPFSGSGDAAVTFATNIQSSIRTADSDGLVGWIVDLRANGGGNMWPMIAGLGPIIGDDTLGHFIDPLGAIDAWEYRNGKSILDGVSLVTVASPYTLKRPRPRVAVLTDNGVASSGEATAIAFRERPDTRTFGFKTCGLSTANSGFGMSDGATLILTVSTMADRTRAKYGGQLVPDEETQTHADMLQRAIAWLQGS